MKPGRNDPCHCGSDKKYKFCCLNQDQLITQLTKDGTDALLEVFKDIDLDALLTPDVGPPEYAFGGERLREVTHLSSMHEFVPSVRDALSSATTLDAPTLHATLESLIVPLAWSREFASLRELMDVAEESHPESAKTIAPRILEWRAQLELLETDEPGPYCHQMVEHFDENPDGFWGLLDRCRAVGAHAALLDLSSQTVRALRARDEVDPDLEWVLRHGIVTQLIEDGKNLEELRPKVLGMVASDADLKEQMEMFFTAHLKESLPADFAAAVEVGDDHALTQLSFLFGEMLVDKHDFSRSEAELARAEIRAMVRPRRVSKKRKHLERAPRATWRGRRSLFIDAEAVEADFISVSGSSTPPWHALLAATRALPYWGSFLGHLGLSHPSWTTQKERALHERLTKFATNVRRVVCDHRYFEMVSSTLGQASIELAHASTPDQPVSVEE